MKIINICVYYEDGIKIRLDLIKSRDILRTDSRGMVYTKLSPTLPTLLKIDNKAFNELIERESKEESVASPYFTINDTHKEYIQISTIYTLSSKPAIALLLLNQLEEWLATSLNTKKNIVYSILKHSSVFTHITKVFLC